MKRGRTLCNFSFPCFEHTERVFVCQIFFGLSRFDVLVRIIAGCYELKPHRVILSRKARYVKTVNGLQGQKTVGVGEHRYRLRWIEGI